MCFLVQLEAKIIFSRWMSLRKQSFIIHSHWCSVEFTLFNSPNILDCLHWHILFNAISVVVSIFFPLNLCEHVSLFSLTRPMQDDVTGFSWYLLHWGRPRSTAKVRISSSQQHPLCRRFLCFPRRPNVLSSC